MTDEFISYLRGLDSEEELDRASEFLVVAATLLDLKVAGLLPQGELVDAEDVALLEARDLLFARLLQYRAFKEASRWFASHLEAESHAASAHRAARGAVPPARARAALDPERRGLRRARRRSPSRRARSRSSDSTTCTHRSCRSASRPRTSSRCCRRGDPVTFRELIAGHRPARRGRRAVPRGARALPACGDRLRAGRAARASSRCAGPPSRGPTRTSRAWEPTMTNDTDAPADAASADAAIDPDAATRRGRAATDADQRDGPELSIVTPLDVPGQPRLDLDRALEAILFIADEPLSVVHARRRRRPTGRGGPCLDRAPPCRLRRRGASGEPRTDVADEAPPPAASVAGSSSARSAAAGGSTCAPTTTRSSPTSCSPSRRRGSRRPRSRRSR